MLIGSSGPLAPVSHAAAANQISQGGTPPLPPPPQCRAALTVSGADVNVKES